MDNKKEVLNKLKYLINKKKSFSKICEELELEDYEIIGLVNLLKEDGMLVDYVNGEIVKSIARQRDDIIYLGSECADLKLGNITVRLYHGKGGSAYALSYKLQKYLDKIPVNERPQILQTGHIHQSFYMKQDHTHCFQTSCLQDLTPYGRSCGFNNDKSCWWLDLESDNKGNIINIDMELETFDKLKRVRRR